MSAEQQTALGNDSPGQAPGLQVARTPNGRLLLRFSGNWRIGQPTPARNEVEGAIAAASPGQAVAFNTAGIGKWDSSLLVFLMDISKACAAGGLKVVPDGLPAGVARILAIATAVPEKKDTGRQAVHKPFLVRVGENATAFWRSTVEIFAFIGEAAASLAALLRGNAGFRWVDFWQLLRECGADALPIVSLISLLVGLILAFVGAIQLQMFGAQIYVADLVGIAMVRVLGAVMTGIIMAGRTGAAFAAQLGTMQVNEELDALETIGISPMEFLVLPRMLALFIMMPLLCLYADLLGVLGGMVVGVGMLDISVLEYYSQTKAAIPIGNLWIGLFHSAVFGILVAMAGCLRGIQCGRSASAVGTATTSAVVTGIVGIIVSTAIITLLCNIIGI